MRHFNEDKLVLATHNKGKVKEIKSMLAPYNVHVLTAGDLDLEEPEETGSTFIANAELKAMIAANSCGLPCLADDSGLSVNALDGEPGIFSARWAGPDKDFAMAMEMVDQKLGDAEDRSAQFVCAMALVWPDGEKFSCEGTVEGKVIWPPRGDKGFGYDPMFVPDGYDITFGEMDPAKKDKMSHRARALDILVADVFESRKKAV